MKGFSHLVYLSKREKNKDEIEKQSKIQEELKMKEEAKKMDSLAKINLIKLDEYDKKSIKRKSGVRIHVIKQE